MAPAGLQFALVGATSSVTAPRFNVARGSCGWVATESWRVAGLGSREAVVHRPSSLEAEDLLDGVSSRLDACRQVDYPSDLGDDEPVAREKGKGDEREHHGIPAWVLLNRHVSADVLMGAWLCI